MAAPKRVGTFECLVDTEYEKVPIALYQCTKTGLKLALAKVQSPTVHGYFAVQTEAFTDYGEPHTLEHLIFLGSERYPYKGVLDVLANRCLAQGTNAWTATDHTAYTVDTAGSEGFLQILPVYLDHVLFPTLRDSGFATEVHHINGEGANAGVVYCEMQARENEADDMCDRAMRLATYPGTCSYKAETGGRLKELRELTNQMVRDYHGKYYRPDNLCVIVTGQVDYTALCEACAPVVESIGQSERMKSLPAFDRPFSSPVPRPDAQQLVRMEFPAEDETTGAIGELCWHGPKWEDLECIAALRMLMAYLTQDSVSPLRKALVETNPPLCGKIHAGLHEYSSHLINITLNDVDVEQLGKRDVPAECVAVLKATAAADGSGIDLTRMQSIIGKKRREWLSSVEADPHDLYSGVLIASFQYAPDFGASGEAGAKALLERFDAPACLSKLLGWSAERWAKLCDQYFTGPSASPGTFVLGTPSKKYGEKVQGDDAARVAAQKESLGEEGCKKAADALAAAEEGNDVDTPDEVTEQFKLPDVSKIVLIDVSSVTLKNSSFEAVSGKDAASLKDLLKGSAAAGLPKPCFQFDHAPGAQFVTCQFMVPTDSLTVRQLELLPLWCDVAFELPLAASALGSAMTYEDVVKALTDVTVSYKLSMGVGGSRFGVGAAGNALHVRIKVERASYAEAPLWIARVLADAKFDVDRLRIAAKRMLNDVPNSKRNGRELMGLAVKAMNYKDECTQSTFNVFRVERTLTALLKDDAALERAATELAELRTSLLGGSPMFVRVAGDVVSFASDAFKPWMREPFTNSSSSTSPGAVPQLALSRELFATDAVRPAEGKSKGCLISSSAEESNYWYVQCDSFSDSRSPELASLLVAIEYITALEGPWWRKIRGKGLAYSYSLSHNLESGLLKFGLFKATDPVGAFKVAQSIIQQLCDESEKDETDETDEKEEKGGRGYNKKEEKEEKEEDEDDEEGDDEGLDPSAVEAAQSGVLFGLIEPVDTIPSAMAESFDCMLRRESPDQLQWLLAAVQDVTEDSVRAALRKHVLPLFTGTVGRTISIACPAQKREKIEEGLKELSPPFEVVHFEVDAFAAALAPPDGFSCLRAKVTGS